MVSADGQYLYYLNFRERRGSPWYSEGPGIWRVPTAGGDETEILPLDERVRSRWVLFEDGICFLYSQTDPVPTIHCFDFETQEVRRLASLPGRPSTPQDFSISSDGEWIVYTQEDASGSDLVLVENFY